MAWNNPGDGNRDGKDPWNNQGNQGPPDLDEAFKKLQKSLGGMFGGHKPGSGGSGGVAGINWSLFGIIAIVLLVVWGVWGVYTVDQQERGLVLRFGKLQGNIVQPGLHWNPPLIDRVLIDNTTRVRDLQFQEEMLTEDENIVKVSMTIQYVIDDISKFLLQVRSPETSLRQATNSALRHEVGSASMDEVLTEGRADLGEKVKQRVQLYMNRYGTGILVTQVNIDETAPPDLVKDAFDDVIKAREDEERFANEASAYANRIVPEARGDAQRQLEQAAGYRQRVISEAKGEAERFNKLYAEYKLAPEVTRERIYIDTMESVMSNSTKVLIDVEGGNNLLYLPLDKLINNAGDGSARSGRHSLSDQTPTRSDPANRTSNRRERN